MEEITMEKLLTDLNGVIAGINELVEKKDIEGARKVLTEVENLVKTANGVELDNLEDQSYDHILHQLLKNISGVIEIAEEKNPNPRILEIRKKIRILELRIEGKTQEVVAEYEKDISKARKDIEKEEAKIAKYREELDKITVLSPEDRRNLMSRRRAAERDYGKAREDRLRISEEYDLMAKTRDEEVRKYNEEKITEVVFSGIDDQEAPDVALARIAKELGIDPSELSINWFDGANDYGDNVATEYEIIRTRAAHEKILLTSERKAYEKELKDLEEELDKLNKESDIPNSIPLGELISKFDEESKRLADEIKNKEELDRLRQALKASGDRRKELKDNGFYEQEAGEAAYYSDLVRQINELEAKITEKDSPEELQARIDDLNSKKNEFDGFKTRRIAEIDAEIAKLTEEVKANNEAPSEVNKDKEELARLREALKASGDRRKELKDNGFYEQEAGEAAYYSDLVRQINELETKIKENDPNVKLEARIAELKTRKNDIDKATVGELLADLEERIKNETDPELKKVLEKDRDLINESINALGIVDPNAERKKELTDKIDIIRNLLAKDDELIAKNPKIAELDKALAAKFLELENAKKIEEEKKKAYEELDGQVKADDEAKKKRKALESKIRASEKIIERRNAKITELTKLIAEVGQNVDIALLIAEKEELLRLLNEQSRVVHDRLDLGEEANRIGDHIFKTAEIRRELADRNVTREEFLEFYQDGYDASVEQLKKLEVEKQAMNQEFVSLFVDQETGKNIQDEILEAKDAKDNEKLKAALEKLRKNFKENGRYNEQLQEMGLLNGEITTDEDAVKFSDFVGKYEVLAAEAMSKLVTEIKNQEENRDIFAREVSIIKAEIQTLEQANGKLETLDQKTDAEKALREKQIRATVFGDDELKAEWEEKLKRFHEHRKTVKGTYVDKDGNVQEVEYETIEDYPEMAEDAFFLNLEDFKKNLETATRYRNSGNDPYSMGQAAVDFMNAADEKKPGSGLTVIEAKVAEMEEYVNTFHGLTNEHAIKYANYRTAGSTLLTMLPVTGELPIQTKMANAATNTFRFLGLRMPKLFKENENGEQVLDIKGAALTTVADALIIGGVTASAIVAGPMGLAPWAIGYASKGIVTVANRIAARREMNRFGDEILDNLPTPYSTSKDAREVARKEYYREEEGMGKFTSWVKAKADRLPFFKDRARETEEAIVKNRVALSNKVIDLRTEEARKAIEENIQTAERNQATRQANQAKEAMSAQTYNDVNRDPDALDKDQATAEIARNAVRKANGLEGVDVNKGSTAERTEQYVKEAEELGKTDELKKVKTKGGSIAATAITEEQHYTGRQQKQDRINRIATMLLTAAGNFGLKAITEGFMRTETEVVQDPDQVSWRQEETPIYEDRVVGQKLDPNKTISEYAYDNVGRNDIYGGSQASTSVGGKIDAVSLGIKGPDGRTIEVSLAESGGGYSTVHVHDIVGKNISEMTPEEIINVFRTTDAENLKRFTEAAGLPQNATDADIALYAIKNGNFYGQTGRMEGWRIADAGGLEDVVQRVQTGTELKWVKDIIPGAKRTITKNVFDGMKLIKGIVDSALHGAVIPVADSLHEAADQTKKIPEGTHEDFTPEAATSKLAEQAKAQLQVEEIDVDDDGIEQDHDENGEHNHDDEDVR